MFFKKRNISVTLIEAATVVAIFAVVAGVTTKFLFTSTRSGARLVTRNKAFHDVNWALEYMVNEARWGINFNVDVDWTIGKNSLDFRRDVDGDGDLDRVWYWRGYTVGGATAGQPNYFGEPDELYRGVDIDNNAPNDLQSLREARDSRQELTTFVVDNPIDPVTTDPYPIFQYNAKTLDIVLTIQDSTSSASQTYRARVVAVNVP